MMVTFEYDMLRGKDNNEILSMFCSEAGVLMGKRRWEGF